MRFEVYSKKDNILTAAFIDENDAKHFICNKASRAFILKDTKEDICYISDLGKMKRLEAERD